MPWTQEDAFDEDAYLWMPEGDTASAALFKSIYRWGDYSMALVLKRRETPPPYADFVRAWLGLDDCPPDWIYKQNPYTLLAMRVGHDSEVVEITDASSLDWQETWHNWDDTATAEHGDVTYTLQMSMGGSGMEYSIAATPGWGPVALLPYNEY